MFGYIRPYFPEMKLREFQRFRACYCGLCHALKRKYGFAARFVLNYDFVFLAMLLWNGEEEICYETRRCAASPFEKKCVCCQNAALDESAAECVILTYWKLMDDRADEKGFKAIDSALARFALRGAYRKAKREMPQYDAAVAEKIAELSELEREGAASLDEAADKFASLLAVSSGCVEDEGRRRVLERMLYHAGRFVYIADAADDIGEDVKNGRYNPLVKRFSVENGTLSEAQRAEVRTTLVDSVNVMAADDALMPRSAWTPVIENIIGYGLPDVADKVSRGLFKKTTRRTLEKELETIGSSR